MSRKKGVMKERERERSAQDGGNNTSPASVNNPKLVTFERL
jgi:hypothetical protein